MTSGPPLTIVDNSFGGWIAWLMAQEFRIVQKLVLKIGNDARARRTT